MIWAVSLVGGWLAVNVALVAVLWWAGRDRCERLDDLGELARCA